MYKIKRNDKMYVLMFRNSFLYVRKNLNKLRLIYIEGGY